MSIFTLKYFHAYKLLFRKALNFWYVCVILLYLAVLYRKYTVLVCC